MVLILNPKFTKWLLEDLGIEKPKLAFEKEALDAYEYRLNDYMQKKNIYY